MGAAPIGIGCQLGERDDGDLYVVWFLAETYPVESCQRCALIGCGP
jgi:hypothetical protein